MFQWRTNGSMSMAKSSDIAAAWILKSESGGAVVGSLEYKSQPLQLRGTVKGKETEAARKWTHRQGVWEPRRGGLHLWLEPQAPGSLEHIADTAAVEMDSTTPRGGVQEEWGSWQSAPRGQMVFCSYWPVSADGERPLLSHTVLVSVNCVRLFTSRLLKNVCSTFPKLHSLKGLSNSQHS